NVPRNAAHSDPVRDALDKPPGRVGMLAASRNAHVPAAGLRKWVADQASGSSGMHLMRVLRQFLILVALAGCSNGHHAATTTRTVPWWPVSRSARSAVIVVGVGGGCDT